MKRFNVLIVLLTACCLSFSAHGAEKFMAGTAKTNITPANARVHDSLYARSLILDAGDTRIAFLSMDVGGYNNVPLMEALKEKHDLDELYFCPSHTHSGSARDRALMEKQLTAVLDMASKNMFEARISGGQRYFPQLSFNRLIVREDGHAREAWYADDQYRYGNKERLPHGPVDPAVGVIKLEDMQGNPRVIVMNYAAHPDALVAARGVISADYVGYATKYTEEAFGGKVNCLFVQGGAGNQGPLFKDPTGTDESPEAYFEIVDRMGKLLSMEAVKLADELYPNPMDEASVKVITDSIDMPNRFDDDIANVHFSTILINGRYAIVTFPGEPFIKFQIDWKREIGPYAVPFFFGYTWNGGKWPTYVPDVRSAALGGYGADWGPVRAPESGEALITRAVLNYYKLSGLYRDSQGPGDHRLDDGTVVWTPDWMK